MQEATRKLGPDDRKNILDRILRKQERDRTTTTPSSSANSHVTVMNKSGLQQDLPKKVAADHRSSGNNNSKYSFYGYTVQSNANEQNKKEG